MRESEAEGGRPPDLSKMRSHWYPVTPAHARPQVGKNTEQSDAVFSPIIVVRCRQVNLQRTRRVGGLDGRIQNRRTGDPQRGYWAQRKPRSARRVRGSSAPRYEARVVSGRSCQEPPRTTWRSPRTSASHS